MSFDNYLLMNEKKYQNMEKDINKYLSDNRDELVEWAKNKIKFYNPSIYTSEKMFDRATRYLINDKYGKYKEEDIKYLINYFSKTLFEKLDMKEMNVGFSDKKLYTDYAASNFDYDNKLLTFYMDRFEDLKNKNPNLLNGLMIVFRDIYRANQEIRIRNNNINFDINDYIIAMETVNAYNSDCFYSKNSEKLIRDNLANMFSFVEAYNYLGSVLPNFKELNDTDYFNSVIDTYNNNINDKSLFMYNLEGDRYKQLDLGVRNVLSINPSFILKYPILAFGYDISGNKKNMVELVSDYDNLVKLIPDKKEDIDKFYKFIMTERYYLVVDKETLKDDVKYLELFLKKEEQDNSFYLDLFNLLKEKRDYNKVLLKGKK